VSLKSIAIFILKVYNNKIKYSIKIASKKTMIIKGYITKTDGTYATVVSMYNEVYDDVLLLYPYGSQSKVKVTDTALVLLFGCNGSKTNLFGIPYEVATQSILEEGDSELKNRVSNNGFKAGNIKNTIAGDTDCDKSFNALSYKVNNIKVVGSQQATINNPAGGTIVDAESRTAIASIITALKNHGLIA